MNKSIYRSKSLLISSFVLISAVANPIHAFVDPVQEARDNLFWDIADRFQVLCPEISSAADCTDTKFCAWNEEKCSFKAIKASMVVQWEDPAVLSFAVGRAQVDGVDFTALQSMNRFGALSPVEQKSELLKPDFNVTSFCLDHNCQRFGIYDFTRARKAFWGSQAFDSMTPDEFLHVVTIVDANNNTLFSLATDPLRLLNTAGFQGLSEKTKRELIYSSAPLLLWIKKLGFLGVDASRCALILALAPDLFLKDLQDERIQALLESTNIHPDVVHYVIAPKLDAVKEVRVSTVFGMGALAARSYFKADELAYESYGQGLTGIISAILRMAFYL